MSPNCVENIYVGPRGFYDVVFQSPEHRSALLAKAPMFFDKRLVHTIDTHGVKSLCFKLKWETFGGHCFECGEWGHFMAECQRHCPSNLEVPI